MLIGGLIDNAGQLFAIRSHAYWRKSSQYAYVYIARLEFRQENLILWFNYVKRLKHYAYLKQLIIFKIFKTNYVHTIHFTHVGKGSSAGKKSKKFYCLIMFLGYERNSKLPKMK